MKEVHPSLIIAAFIIIIAGMMNAGSIINPLFMAIFICIICTQPIRWMKNKRVPPGTAVITMIIGIFAVYIGFFQLLSGSITRFVNDAPKYAQNWDSLIESVRQVLDERGIKIEVLEGSSALDPSKIMKYTTDLFSSFTDVMSSEFTFLLLVIFLLTELDSISIKARAYSKASGKSLDYMDRIGRSIRHYLSIKTFTSFITGLFIAIFLAIIGVDYAILWGFVAFLLNYIPNIGSIIAAIPAVIFSVLQLGPVGALWTIVVFVVVNVVIGNLVEPKMMGKGLGLSTFVVFLGLIFWGFVLGPVGMFLSVPLMMVIKIALEQHQDTRWMASWLGTGEEAKVELER
jgi:predicted PurR-regulated permease PerM